MNDIGGKRLWIGNLDERITEFTLLKLLQKYGKIEQFDFLFHKSGPNQGKPRGYCFASYEKRTDAVHALHSLDGKLALGKKLVVKWAHSHIKQTLSEPVPLEPVINLNPDKIPGTFGGSATKVAEEPTGKKRPYNPSIHSQIRAIEGKLKEMERQTAKSTFKPIPVYAAKRPKTPTEVTEKCLPSLLTIEVRPPTSSTPATSTSSLASSSSIPTLSSSSSSAAAAAAGAPTSTTSLAASSSTSTSSSAATMSSSVNDHSLVSTSTEEGPERTGTIITTNKAPSLSSLSSSSSSSSSSVSKTSGVSQTAPKCSSTAIKSLTIKPSGKTTAVSRPKPYDKR